MKPPPDLVENARVLLYTPIDSRHQHTGATRHVVAGELLGSVAALAICQYPAEPGVYLFYCSAAWEAITDTWHESVEDARAQAAFEYIGVEATWSSREGL